MPDLPDVADLQPLAAEIVHERADAPVLDHARDLLFEHRRRWRSSPFAASAKSSASGMVLQRKYESREATS